MKEYVTNLFEVDSYSESSNSRLRFWYQHIKKTIHHLEGDIFEFGVYRGSSIIAVALLLKELNSSKKVYGFDSFSGFPSLCEYDDLDSFYKFRGSIFSEEFIKEYEDFLEVKSIIENNSSFDPLSIATSGSFNQTSKELINKKIDYFSLDNIVLIEGDFKQSVPKFFKENKIKISSANIDCDLYEGYKTVLPFIYENLVDGGYVHLDEYYSFKYPGAKIACDEFFSAKSIIPKKNNTRIGEFERWFFQK